MAQVSAYSTAHGKRYRVRFRTPDGRQTDKRGFRTKREAEAAMNRIEVDKLTGSCGWPRSTARKQILWESDTATDAEVRAMEVKLIRDAPLERSSGGLQLVAQISGPR